MRQKVLCHRAEVAKGFQLQLQIVFLQCDWQREKSLQKVININEVQGISRTSTDPLLSQLGSGHETRKGETHFSFFRTKKV